MDSLGLANSSLNGGRLDKEDVLSNNDLIFLSASPGIGKSHFISHSQVLRFNHQLGCNLTSLHNNSKNFWSELFRLCEESGWFNVNETDIELCNESYFDDIQRLAKRINRNSRKYSQQGYFYLVFDNIHLITTTDLLEQLKYFVQLLNTSIKCIFSGRDHVLYHLLKNTKDKKAIVLNDNDFILSYDDFYQALFEQLKVTSDHTRTNLLETVINSLYQLVQGHVGLGIHCFQSDYIQHHIKQYGEFGKNESPESLAFHLVQAEDIHEYFSELIKPLLSHELAILSLPLINRALIIHLNLLENLKSHPDKSLNFYLEHGTFNSHNQIQFYPKPLFSHWLTLNVKIDESYSYLLSTAIEEYRRQEYWSEAILCAIKIKDLEGAVELVCQAARYFSRRGQYHQARDLISHLPRIENPPLFLSLFENLLDFQQYGHQVASRRLNALLDEQQGNSIDLQCQELIALLQYHYGYLLHPEQNGSRSLKISQYTQLFNREHELCGWAWHSLAMEQVLAGDHIAGLDSLIKAIHWSLQQEDAPCALASLGLSFVPCLQQGKLSLALEYCQQIEDWLRQKQLTDFAMASTIHRVRILIYREQGQRVLAEESLPLMQSFYPKLDPLNLAYCYWAEFLLLLAQQNFIQARRQLAFLEGHVAAYFDGWQLVLPKPELLSAILDSLAGSELAMLKWASQFQLEHIDESTDWLDISYPPFQSEIIAYIRVRITLGSDMTEPCNRLNIQADSMQDKLLGLHGLILSLLNAHRQENEMEVNQYRHILLNKAGVYEFYQVYKEYLDELMPLLKDYQALPSEYAGYEKIIATEKRQQVTEELEPEIHDAISGTLFDSLTTREKQVAQLVITGLSNKEISEDLTIGLATVKGHVGNIYNKLGIKRRAQLANLISPPS